MGRWALSSRAPAASGRRSAAWQPAGTACRKGAAQNWKTGNKSLSWLGFWADLLISGVAFNRADVSWESGVLGRGETANSTAEQK